MRAPKVVTEVPARTWPRGRAPGEARVALVPTLGYLHAGHVSLMRAARERVGDGGKVLVSIFVNPLQFGPTEDFARYPRDLEGDLEKCASAGVDEVFHPDAAAFYPPGFQTSVEVGALAEGLCGARRPGHFRGVATVVYRLFALLQPDVALFGEKDFQQLRVIQRMTADLALPVEIAACPIVREPDGLALSSRNAYLTDPERERALSLSKGLRAAQRAFAEGERRAEVLTGLCREALQTADARLDYVELCDPETLRPVRVAERRSRLLLAAFVGKTRLIDNLQLG